MIEHCATLVRNTPLPRMSNEMRGVIQGLKRKIKEGDLIVTKADEGNAVVVMEKSAYVSKVHVVLQQCGAKESEDFSFTNHVAEVRSVINNLLKLHV